MFAKFGLNCIYRLPKALIQLRFLSNNIRYPAQNRGKLFTMMIDSPEFRSLFTPEFKELGSLFKKYKYEIRIAGGAVRDILMKKTPVDVDFATTATPDEMIKMFSAENIRMINKKGEKHGTITARINDKENFEVTTLRIDVVTDGRHAEVEFTTDWELDANRRDLTINSMFLDFDGNLYDFFNGKDDLDKRKLKFVGDPVLRIQEDFLRILRYFRFYGRIAKNDSSHEKETLDAIKNNVEGLKGISGERLWMELKKIVVGNYSPNLMKIMSDLGVLKNIAFPQNLNHHEFEKVFDIALENNFSLQPMTCIGALLDNEEQVHELNQRLKLSNEEMKYGLFIVSYKSDFPKEDIMKFSKDLFIDTVQRDPKIKDRICEILKYFGYKSCLDEFMEWGPPRFPVNGKSLALMGIKGPKMSLVLNELRNQWKKSNFMMSCEELLEEVPAILKKIEKS